MELQLEGLSKTYGTVQALRKVTYTFKPGIYGILGANGAGKSTMINLITDNVSRDSGSDGGKILYDGEDILKLGKRFRAIVGYMPQQQGFYDDFPPKAFLKYMAEVKGLKGKNAEGKTVNQQIDELLEVVNLTGVAHKKIGGFSGGMKQRVLLAQALLAIRKYSFWMSRPRDLTQRSVSESVTTLPNCQRIKSFYLQSHVVSDIECIADHVLLIKKGQIVATGTPVELIEKMQGKVAEITCTLDDVGALQAEYKVGNIRQRKNGLALRLVGDILPKEAVPVEDNIDLEDVYLYYFE